MNIIFLKAQDIFTEDGSQNYFIFQPLLKYFQASRTIVNANIMRRTSKGLSDQSIKPYATSDNNFSKKLDYSNNPKFRVNFDRSCLTIEFLLVIK